MTEIQPSQYKDRPVKQYTTLEGEHLLVHKDGKVVIRTDGRPCRTICGDLAKTMMVGTKAEIDVEVERLEAIA